jgi:hypothetical protein
MPKINQACLTIMALAIFSSGCATKIYDFKSCGLIPGGLGADCDNFLTSAPQSLTEAQWEALEASWNAAGSAVECIQSASLAQLKGELEKLCTTGKCTYQEAEAFKTFFLKIQRDEAVVREKLQ